MGNLRLPIRDRRDLMIFAFDEAEIAPDVAAERTVRSLIASSPSASPIPLRVVPLSDRDAYDEALRLMLSKPPPPGVVAVWVVDFAAARFGLRFKREDGSTGEATHAIRIIQVMAN